MNKQDMQDKPERLHFMDSMRAILMMLGIVLHSALVFDTDLTWRLYSNNTDQFFTYLVSIISTFRMPAFFVVSGYFCFLTLNKYKVRKFLTVRLKRIIIPFIFTALTLNSLQAGFLDWTGWQQFEISNYIFDGGYVSHLWFLTNLMVYFVIASLLVAFFKPVLKLIGGITSKVLNSLPMIVVIFLLPSLSIMVLMLRKIGFPLYSDFFGVFKMYSIMEYAPFFIFGAVIAMDKKFLHRFSTTNPIICLVVIFVSISIVGHIENLDSRLSAIAVLYLNVLSSWFSVLLCFSFFFHYLNKKSITMLYLSDASYSVYLFHHVFVVMVGVLLIALDFPAILGGFTLIFVVAAITLFIHSHIISKNKYLLFMFNGK